MKIDDAQRLLGIVVTDNQRLASAYLESIGNRFCVEHGLDNCERMANEAVDDDFSALGGSKCSFS